MMELFTNNTSETNRFRDPVCGNLYSNLMAEGELKEAERKEAEEQIRKSGDLKTGTVLSPKGKMNKQPSIWSG